MTSCSLLKLLHQRKASLSSIKILTPQRIRGVPYEKINDMTPKPVYSTGITLRCQTCILLSASCLCLEVPRHLKLSSPQNTISSRLPTVQRVHCISCLRAWHNHPTHHTLDSTFLIYSPPSPSFTPNPNFCWFYFVKYLSNLSLSLHFWSSHFSLGLLSSVIKQLTSVSVWSPSIISLYHYKTIFI